MWRRMVTGAPYLASDPELVSLRHRAQHLLRRYNATVDGDDETRDDLLAELLGACGPGCTIRAPFHCDYGANIRLGAGVFLNFGCVVLDVCAVTIGENSQIGPCVQLLAADHPRDPAARRAGWELGRPVTIGRNAWIGGGALLLPGVTVGDDAVIGAGAVVTRDVPRGRTVAGNPARPLPRS
jgi:maltose O-acetyltransferase